MTTRGSNRILAAGPWKELLEHVNLALLTATDDQLRALRTRSLPLLS